MSCWARKSMQSIWILVYLIYQGVLGGIKRAEVGCVPQSLFIGKSIKNRESDWGEYGDVSLGLDGCEGFDMDFEGHGFEECDRTPPASIWIETSICCGAVFCTTYIMSRKRKALKPVRFSTKNALKIE